MAYTNDQITGYVNNTLSGGGNWADIWNTAQQQNVSLEQLAGAYGMTADQGAQYLQNQGVSVDGYPSTQTTTNTQVPSLSQTTSTTTAQNPPTPYAGATDFRNWVTQQWGIPQGTAADQQKYYSAAFNSDGTYNTSDVTRNKAVLGAGIARGMTPQQLAESLNLPLDQVMQYIQGQSASTMENFAQMYNINGTNGMYGVGDANKQAGGQTNPFKFNLANMGYMTPDAWQKYQTAYQNGFYNPQTDAKIPIWDGGKFVGYKDNPNPYATLPDYLQGTNGYQQNTANLTPEAVNTYRAAHPDITDAQLVQDMQKGLVQPTPAPAAANAVPAMASPLPQAAAAQPQSTPTDLKSTVASLWQAGDIAGLNQVLAQNNVTSDMAAQAFGLSPETMASIAAQGVNFAGGSSPQPQAAAAAPVSNTQQRSTAPNSLGAIFGNTNWDSVLPADNPGQVGGDGIMNEAQGGTAAVGNVFGDGKTWYMTHEPAGVGGEERYVLWTDRGTINKEYDAQGNFIRDYKGNEAGITFGDILRGAATIAAGMGLGALVTPAAGAGAAAGAAGAETAAPATNVMGASGGATDFSLAGTGAGGTGLQATAGPGLQLATTTGGPGIVATAGPGLDLAAATGGGLGLDATVGGSALLSEAGLGTGLANGTGTLLGPAATAGTYTMADGTIVPGFTSTGVPITPGVGGGTGGGTTTGGGGTPVTPGVGGIDLNKLLSGLAGLAGGIHDSNAQRDAANNMLDWMKSQQAKIDALYAPGSPEYNLLKQQMEAKDAAAGRNSQYGVRAVDMAAKIAQIKAQYTAQLTQGLAGNFQSAFNQNASADSGLASIIGSLLGGTNPAINVNSLVSGLSGLFT